MSRSADDCVFPAPGHAVEVLGLGLWMPGFPDVRSWLDDLRDPECVKPAGRSLDRVNRRRAGPLGRALSDAVNECLDQAGLDAATTPIVVGSAIGEARTMVGLLEQIWRTGEPVSPAAFTVSVHNAAAGLISISNKNRGYTSALSASYDTPAATLLEAISLVITTRSPVAIVCGDEPVPYDLVPERDGWLLQAAAVALGPVSESANRAHDALASLRVTADGVSDLAPAALEVAAARNPQAGMVDLIAAVHRGDTGCLRLDRGRGRGYCARLEAACTP